MTNELLDYFDGDQLAAEVWLNKYALKNSEGVILEKTPEQMFRRMAKEIYRIESRYPNPMTEKEILDMLDGFKYIILGGSNMFGIGNKYQISSLANCFAIPAPQDSIGGIFKSDQELAQIMKRRGGVGIDISSLRSRGSKVTNSAGITTGAISFAEEFSDTTKRIAQNGRRGALMITLDVNHPDIKEFITAKLDTTKLNGANISVKVTNKFMRAVVREEPEEIEIFNLIAKSAWKSAEPGILFWDHIIDHNPAEIYAKTITTNPCGEVPLSEYDSCRLASMNLTNFVIFPYDSILGTFDFVKYRAYTEKAQRIMDDIIDLEAEKILAIIDKINSDPEDDSIKHVELNLWENILYEALSLRRTGLGFTGLADVFAMLNIKYDSEANDFVNELGLNHAAATYKSSIILANERGAFDSYDMSETSCENEYLSKVFGYIENIYSDEYKNIIKLYSESGRRNAATMAIAPNGTISIVSQTSSGIEPIFQGIYKRRVKNSKGDFDEFIVIHPGFKNWLYYGGYTWKTEEDLKELFKESPYFGSESHDVDPIAKVVLQSILQNYIDHSISVTHNLPNSATINDVKSIYLTSWKLGCKGCTVYRDGSRQGILETTNKFKPIDAIKRPKTLAGKIHKISSKGSKFLVIIGFFENNPYEIFALRSDDDYKLEQIPDNSNCFITKVSSGKYNLSCMVGKTEIVIDNFTELYTTDEEVLTRLLSLSMRHYADVTFAYEQIMAVKNRTISDFSTAIAKVLSKYINNDKVKNTQCPECNGKLIMAEGCITCQNCGYSKC